MTSQESTKDCKGRGCRPSCCEDLLAQLGVPNPGDANLYDVLTKIVTNIVQDTATVTLDLPWPARTVFVSFDWNGDEDNEHTFLTVQGAVDFAATLATPLTPWTVYIYAGIYGQVIGAPNVNIVGIDKSSVSLENYAYVLGPSTTGADRTLVSGVTIGNLRVDTALKTDLSGSTLEFDNVTTGGGNHFIQLRSSVGGVSLLGRDAVSFRNSQVIANDFDYLTLGPVATSNVVLFDDCLLFVGALFSIIGTATPDNDLRRTTEKVTPRHARKAKRGPFENIIPSAPLRSAVFLFIGGQGFQVGTTNIENCNVLIQDTLVDSSVTGVPATISLSGSVFNNSNTTYTEDVNVFLNAGVQGSLVNSEIPNGNLSGPGAMDRTTQVGSVPATVLTNPASYGGIVPFPVDYVNNTYTFVGSVNSTLGGGGTPTILTTEVKTVSSAQLALSNAPLALTDTVDWVATQDAKLIPFS